MQDSYGLFYMKASLPGTVLLGYCSLNVDVVVVPQGSASPSVFESRISRCGGGHSDENSPITTLWVRELKA